jgi:hypothetical protein
MRGNKNRKVSKGEKARATQIIQDAYPGFDVVWGSHSAYGGHRAPRDHTIAFRIRDANGKYRSNVIWMHPDEFKTITAQDVRSWIGRRR